MNNLKNIIIKGLICMGYSSTQKSYAEKSRTKNIWYIFVIVLCAAYYIATIQAIVHDEITLTGFCALMASYVFTFVWDAVRMVHGKEEEIEQEVVDDQNIRNRVHFHRELYSIPFAVNIITGIASIVVYWCAAYNIGDIVTVAMLLIFIALFLMFQTMLRLLAGWFDMTDIER